MIKFIYGLSIWIIGDNLDSAFIEIVHSNFISGNKIKNIRINYEDIDSRLYSRNNLDKLPIKEYKEVDIYLPDFQSLSYKKNWGVDCRTSENYEISFKNLILELQKIKFELLCIPQTPSEGDNWDNYDSPNLSGFPLERLGFLLSFKKTGHNHLVSRRWLDFGPWWTIKGKDDCSIVIFHDPEADPETALEQAKPGHQRMGVTDEGGFIEKYYNPKFEPQGFYIPAEKKLKVIVHGRKVSQREMLDAACFKYHHKNIVDNSEMKELAASIGGTLSDQSDKIDRANPVEQVAYIFMEEKVAREHLHELWLRELECWAIINGVETRLDLDYNPIPVKPDWVKKCEERYPELSQK